jgi:uncharacterized protein DUF4147
MVLPAGEMTLADKQAVNRSLLASGANIVEMNAVRKRLSAIKGGRLAVAAYPARVVTLAISDIPGDDPAAIASGPTVADSSTLADVHEIIERYNIDLPNSASAVLAAHMNPRKYFRRETPSVSSPLPRLPWPRRLRLRPRPVSRRLCLATRLRVRAAKSVSSWRALPARSAATDFR